MIGASGTYPLNATYNTASPVEQFRFGYYNHATGTVEYPASGSSKPANVIIIGQPFNGTVAVIPANWQGSMFFIRMKSNVLKGGGIKAEDATGLGVPTSTPAEYLRRAGYDQPAGSLVSTYAPF